MWPTRRAARSRSGWGRHYGQQGYGGDSSAVGSARPHRAGGTRQPQEATREVPASSIDIDFNLT